MHVHVALDRSRFHLRTLLSRIPCTLVTLALIWAMFIVELSLHAPGHQDVLVRLGALPGEGFTPAQSWRLLAHALLHAGWWHLGLNTALLLIAGPPLERWLGPTRWIFTALLGAVSGGLAGLLAMHGAGSVAIGASGAFFALLFAACLRSGPCHASPGLRRRLWITLTAGVLYSLMPGVGLAAHVGGMAVGAVMVYTGPAYRRLKEHRA
ncbi:MAG: rhomboid family intramembrane serine protease [Pseudoxanthomonas sp.]